jgi:Zn-dependent peptidase ImmA (M78 family)
MRTAIKNINNQVKAIFNEIKVDSLPVKIEDIAKQRGLRVMPYAFDEDISGVLVIEDGQGTIGYNQSESRVRRRFTIAHELGHYELHKEKSKLFMDKGFRAIFHRKNTGITEDTKKMEEEANAFAASILMPDHLLIKELEKIEFDLSSEDDIKNLAKIFDVSSTAMYYRIRNSGLLALG